MSQVYYGRGYVYSIKYHIVWCVKYRRKVLKGRVEETLYENIKKIAKENGIEVHEINGDSDHVHMLIECKPQHFIPNIIKALKGSSARQLFKIHPELKKQLWGGHMWNPSYFIATVSENTENQIRQYISSQKEK